jgi:hypothetical protein
MSQPEPLEKWEIEALRAMWQGQADAGVCERAMKLIIERFGRLYFSSHVPGDPYQTAFNEGRRAVAQDLMRALTSPIEDLTKEEEHGPADPAERIRDRRSAQRSTRRTKR